MLLLVITITSCEDKTVAPKKVVEVKSKFNLQKDYADFKMKMSESDTIRIMIDRSICDYEGHERLLVTKKNDSLKIISELKDIYTKNEDWEKIYEKKVSAKDTLWGFGSFLSKNKDKLKNENSGGRLVITDGRKALKYSSEIGLIQSLNFIADINQTMEVLHPNKDYYLVRIPELPE